MLLWVFLTIAFTCGTGFGIAGIICHSIDKKRVKLRNSVIVFLLSVALTSACLLTALHSSDTDIRGAEVVAIVYENGNEMNLYYDANTDEYFVLKTNLFNLFNTSDRSIINKNNASRYVEIYNELKSIDMKGTVK